VTHTVQPPPPATLPVTGPGVIVYALAGAALIILALCVLVVLNRRTGRLSAEGEAVPAPPRLRDE